MKNAVITPCSHFFHAGCLKKWLYVQETCPLCHAQLKGQSPAAAAAGATQDSPPVVNESPLAAGQGGAAAGNSGTEEKGPPLDHGTDGEGRREGGLGETSLSPPFSSRPSPPQDSVKTDGQGCLPSSPSSSSPPPSSSSSFSSSSLPAPSPPLHSDPPESHIADEQQHPLPVPLPPTASSNSPAATTDSLATSHPDLPVSLSPLATCRRRRTVPSQSASGPAATDPDPVPRLDTRFLSDSRDSQAAV